MSSEIIEKDENVYEKSKIKVSSVDGKRSTISSFLRTKTILDHSVSVVKMLDLNEEDQANITQATPTYSVDVQFNYVSQDYDNLQVSIPEHNLNSFLDECTKNEVLNFKKLKNARLANFSRGDQMKNFVVPAGSSDKFSKTAPYKVRIGINDRVEGKISDFLQKLTIYDEVLHDYVTSEKTPIPFNIREGRVNREDTELMGYDISSFFDSNSEIDVDNFYGLNQEGKASKMSYDFRKHLFKGYLKGVTKTGFRSFSDILRKTECYKEALCYSFEKFNQFSLESTRLQNIYAPAGSLATSFSDTQVKYGATYVYKANAHYMVVGNIYSYENIRYFEEDGVEYATATVINRPNIVVLPFYLFDVSKSIIQPPPVFPQVNFKTENNSKNEIQIYLSPTKSEVKADFVEVTTSDAEQRQLMTQFFSNKNGTFRFHTSVESGLFEVFRLNYPPESIKDFSNAKLGEIRMSYRSTDAIFKDNVDNNKEYYYMFRQVNEKGLVSNPTSIFKTRLVVDADDAKVVVNTYVPPKKVTSQPSRLFKSMMQIKPSVEQTLFNSEQSALLEKGSAKGVLDQLKLGSSQESVWGRKFKLRVRSKTSGKIIDLNINFELTKNKTKEEF
jgi:hypothetical protein